MSLLAIAAGRSSGGAAALYLHSQWHGQPANSTLALRLTDGRSVWCSQVEAEAIRDRSTRTSLQQDDYRHKLAAAFADSGLLDFIHEVAPDFSKLTTKYRTADGVKVVLLQSPLTAAASSGEILFNILLESTLALDRLEADTERMHAEQQRTEKQAEQMELRAAEIPTEMDDLLEANKPLLVSAINRRKEEIRSLKRSLGGDASRTARSAAAGRQSQPLPRSSEPLPAAGRTAKRPNESSASQEVAEAAVSPPKRGPVSRTSSKEEASQPIATTAVADPLLQLAGGLAGGGGSTAATQPETASALAGRPRRRKATAVHVQPVDDLDDL